MCSDWMDDTLGQIERKLDNEAQRLATLHKRMAVLRSWLEDNAQVLQVDGITATWLGTFGDLWIRGPFTPAFHGRVRKAMGKGWHGRKWRRYGNAMQEHLEGGGGMTVVYSLEKEPGITWAEARGTTLDLKIDMEAKIEGSTCRLVQVGTKVVEKPIWKQVCDES